MLKIDFLDNKIILRYVFFILLALLGGTFFKDGIAILFSIVIIYFSIKGDLYRAIELFFIWFFIYDFFVGQGDITSVVISKYFSKPTFLLIVIFVFFINRIPKNLLTANFMIIWGIFLIITILSAVTQGQSPLVFISISAFFIVFLLMQAQGLTINQYTKILNLFIAVAIIQTAVSYLQVSGLISPPTTTMNDGFGGQQEWVAGLDDAASGTFGAAASYLTSWYAALISTFMLLMYFVTKKFKYLIYMSVVFLQFTTVDSKTILAITIMMLAFTFVRVFKERSNFRINLRHHLLILILIFIGGIGFFYAWNTYYEYYSSQTEDSSRANLDDVYDSEVQTTIDVVSANISDWGKIKGFQYIFNDFIKNNPIQLIWGYGIQGFDYNGKMGFILSKDTPLMQTNSFTNSYSGLIRQFAFNGVVGFILYLAAIISWFKKCSDKISNNYNLIKNNLLNIYLPFSFLAAFLYALDFTSIPLVAFAAIISILIKISQYNYVIRII